jgi:hypothetical protein
MARTFDESDFSDDSIDSDGRSFSDNDFVEEEEAGWGETLGASSVIGIGGMGADLMGAARAIRGADLQKPSGLRNTPIFGELLGFAEPAIDQAIDYWIPQESAEDAQLNKSVARQQALDELNIENSPSKQLGFTVGEGIAPSLVSAPLGPLGAGALLGAQAGGQQYMDLLSKGVSPDEASLSAGTYAAGSGLLEQLPFARGLKGGKRLLTPFMEGLEESGQEALDIGLDYLSTDELPENPLGQIAQAGAIGTVGGTAFAGAKLGSDLAFGDGGLLSPSTQEMESISQQLAQENVPQQSAPIAPAPVAPAPMPEIAPVAPTVVQDEVFGILGQPVEAEQQIPEVPSEVTQVLENPNTGEITPTNIVEVPVQQPDGSQIIGIAATPRQEPVANLSENQALAEQYYAQNGAMPPGYVDPSTIKFPDTNYKKQGERKLTGEYDVNLFNPVEVWQRKDGSTEVHSGRNRVRFAVEKGKQLIPARIWKEEDGYDLDFMQTLDAEQNIKAGDGSVYDMVSYLRKKKVTSEQAKAKGFDRYDWQRDGIAIAENASPNLYTAFMANKIRSSSKVAAIAKAAPGNDFVQDLGIKEAMTSRMSAEELGDFVSLNQAEFVNRQAGITDSSAQQIGILEDNSDYQSQQNKFKEWAVNATELKAQLTDTISAVRGAAKNPEAFQELTGLPFSEDKAVKLLEAVKELEAERAKFGQWQKIPEIREEVKTLKTPSVIDRIKQRLMSETGATTLFGEGPAIIREIGDQFNMFRKKAINEPGGRDPADVDRFFHGAVGAVRQKFITMATLANMDPEFSKKYDAGMHLFQNNERQNQDFSKRAKPYFLLKKPSQEKVAKFLDSMQIAQEQGVKVDLSPEGMAQRGLNAPEIAAVDALRNSFGRAVDVIRNGLLLNPPGDIAAADAKIKEVMLKMQQSNDAAGVARLQAELDIHTSARDAYYKKVDEMTALLKQRVYFPRTREGNYIVYLKNGARLPDGRNWTSLHKSGAQAREAMAHLREQGVDPASIAHGPLIEKVKDEKDEFVNLDITVLAHLAEVSTIAKDALQRKLGRTADLTQPGFIKHLQQSKNYAGYSTDDLVKSPAKYFAGLSRWYSQQIFSNEWKQSKINKNKTSLVLMADKYYSYLKDNTPELATLRRGLNAYYLTRPVSAIANLTQNFTTTIPKAISYVGVGKGYSFASSGLSDYIAYESGKLKKDSDLYKAFLMADDSAITKSTHSEATANLQKSDNKFEKITDSLLFMFNAAERVNRGTAFATGWKIAEEQKLDSFQDKFDFATKFTFDTQFDNSKATKPEIARGGVGSLFTMYRLFQGNNIKFMRDLVSRDNKRGQYGIKALATAVAHSVALGGVRAFPFAPTFMAIAEGMGVDTSELLKDALPDEIEDSFLYGMLMDILPAIGLPGVSLAGNLQSDLIPGIGEEYKGVVKGVGGPAVGIGVNAIDALDTYLKLPETAKRKALEKIAPPLLRNMSEALSFQDEGVIRDKQMQDISSELFGKPEGLDRALNSLAMAGGFSTEIKQKSSANKYSTTLKAAKGRDNGNINARVASIAAMDGMEAAQEFLADLDPETYERINWAQVEKFYNKGTGGFYQETIKQSPKRSRDDITESLLNERDKY